MPVKVLVADDSHIIRSMIVRALKEDASLSVVGEAASFAEALSYAAALKPDIVVLDLLMPDESRFTSESIKSGLLQAGCVLAISIWNDDEAQFRAKSYGARKLLDKSRLAAELIPTIKLFCLPHEP